MENLVSNELKIKYLKVINKMIELMKIHVLHQAATTHKTMSPAIAALMTQIEHAHKAALQAKNRAERAVEAVEDAIKKFEIAKTNRVQLMIRILGEDLLSQDNYINRPEYQNALAEEDKAIEAFRIAKKKQLHL